MNRTQTFVDVSQLQSRARSFVTKHRQSSDETMMDHVSYNYVTVTSENFEFIFSLGVGTQ